MKDAFRTLAAPAEGYYMDRGSKFLAYAFPVTTEEEAHERLQELRKMHPKARHYCTALRLHPDASLERNNDDGEPSGSAGKPILGQLIRNDLTNVFVVVVRYFGGTKLGVPGLIEAYKTSAANALDVGKVVERKVYAKISIRMSYETQPGFMNVVRQREFPVIEEQYTNRAEIVIGLPVSTAEADLLALLRQYSQLDFETPEEYAERFDLQIQRIEDVAIY